MFMNGKSCLIPLLSDNFACFFIKTYVVDSQRGNSDEHTQHRLLCRLIKTVISDHQIRTLVTCIYSSVVCYRYGCNYGTQLVRRGLEV